MLDPPRKRHLIRTIGIVILGTLVFLGLTIVIARLTKTPEKNVSGLPAQMIYNKNIICEDAWEHDLHHENDRISHFDLQLRPVCFDGLIYLPKLWEGHNWYTQPIGDQTAWWYSMWRVGAGIQAEGAFGPNQNGDHGTQLTPFRLQGNGTIRFYTNIP